MCWVSAAGVLWLSTRLSPVVDVGSCPKCVWSRVYRVVRTLWPGTALAVAVVGQEAVAAGTAAPVTGAVEVAAATGGVVAATEVVVATAVAVAEAPNPAPVSSAARWEPAATTALEADTVCSANCRVMSAPVLYPAVNLCREWQLIARHFENSSLKGKSLCLTLMKFLCRRAIGRMRAPTAALQGSTSAPLVL